MKKHCALLFFVFFVSTTYAHALGTNLCLENVTKEDMLIQVLPVANFDWDNDNRPDHNWHNTTLKAGELSCRRADVNLKARGVSFSVLINGTNRSKFYFDTTPLRVWSVYNDDWSKPIIIYGRDWGKSDHVDWAGVVAGIAFNHTGGMYGMPCSDKKLAYCGWFRLGPMPIKPK